MIKRFIIAFATLGLLACSSSKEFKNPEGYKNCGADSECPSGYYCGFVYVDSGAVCRQRPYHYQWHRQ